MTSTNLEKGDFRECDFTDGVLDKSILSGSDCSQAKFTAASLRECDAQRRVNFSRTNFEGANLSSAKLADANLSGANMKGCILEHSDLSGANLKGAELDDAVLENASLEDADLAAASLRRANLTNANFNLARKFNSKQQGVVFHNTTMPDGETKTGTLQFRRPPSVDPKIEVASADYEAFLQTGKG